MATHCPASSQTLQARARPETPSAPPALKRCSHGRRGWSQCVEGNFPLFPQPFRLCCRAEPSAPAEPRASGTSLAGQQRHGAAAALSKVRAGTGLTTPLPNVSLTQFSSTQQTLSPGNRMLSVGSARRGVFAGTKMSHHPHHQSVLCKTTQN